jgi:hypothetical protein
LIRRGFLVQPIPGILQKRDPKTPVLVHVRRDQFRQSLDALTAAKLEPTGRVVVDRDSEKCNGSTCYRTQYREQYEYTGKIKPKWETLNWDDPSLRKTEIDLIPITPLAKLRALEVKVSFAEQPGEILHEIRVDRAYRDVKVDLTTLKEQLLSYGETKVGTEYRWVTTPSGKHDVIGRTQIQISAGILGIGISTEVKD